MYDLPDRVGSSRRVGLLGWRRDRLSTANHGCIFDAPRPACVWKGSPDACAGLARGRTLRRRHATGDRPGGATTIFVVYESSGFTLVTAMVCVPGVSGWRSVTQPCAA